MVKIVSSILVLCALTGCATVTSGKYQPLTVNTTTTDGKVISGADCEFKNSNAVSYGKSGSTLNVRRDNTPLEVKCTTDELSGNESLKNKLNPAVWGNILIGGLFGVIVDASTKASSRYDEMVNVIMRKNDTESTNVE